MLNKAVVFWTDAKICFASVFYLSRFMKKFIGITVLNRCSRI